MEAIGLTKGQKALLEKRLETLLSDFPVLAVRVLCEGGVEWSFGKFPQDAPPQKEAPRRKRRTLNPDEPYGHLSKIIMPWLKLVHENAGAPVLLRTSDFQGQPLKRVSKALSSSSCYWYGNGHLRVCVIPDEIDGEALLVESVGGAVKKRDNPRENPREGFSVNTPLPPVGGRAIGLDGAGRH